MNRNSDMKHSQKCWGRTMAIALILGIPGLGVPIMALSAQAQTPSAIRQGYALLERGWANDAIAAFRQVLQRYPQSLEAKLGLAIAYQRTGQDANAWEAYQQVLRQDPNQHQALLAVGELGGYRSEWQPRGIAALTTLLNLNANDTAARAQRALLYGYQSRFAEALADYAIVLQGNPSPTMILSAAQIYTYSGDMTQGLELFNRYRATGRSIPNSAITAYALALQSTGEVDTAIHLLETRLQALHHPDATAIQIRSALAIAYQVNQQSDAALTTLAPLRGQTEARLPLARALSAIGRQVRASDSSGSDRSDLYEQAVDLYRQVLSATSDPTPGLVTEVADVWSESPSAQSAALQLYQQLITQQPQNQSLAVKRLVLQYQLGQLSSSDLQQQLDDLLQTLPSAHTDQQAIAQTLLRLDPPDPALLPLYQKLLSAGVDVPFLNFRVAQIFVQQGKLTESRQALAIYTATPAGGSDSAPALLLADIDRRADRLDDSAQRYETIIAQNPNVRTLKAALRGLAGIRMAQGRTTEALAVYDRLVTLDPNDLTTQLGRTNLAYQTQRISETEAVAVLDRWLSNPTANSNPTASSSISSPPELFALVGSLPPSPQRLALYESLLAIEPSNLTINRRWLQVIAIQDPDQAIARVNQLIAQTPDDINVYFIQGELAQALKDLPLASQSYTTILQRQPDNVDALSALGGVRFQQRQFEAATRIYRQVLVLKPNDRETHRILAELQAAQAHPLTALQQFRQIQTDQADQTNQPNESLDDRILRLQIDLLRQRGFQPTWERY
jgi:cellulose synthase operon protein C